MWILKLLGIVPTIVGTISDHFKHKREVKQAVAVRQIELVHEAKMGDQNWEMLQAKNSGASWKDEFWTLIFGFLLVVPVYDVEIALRVFRAFDAAPSWFQTCVLVSVGASFGVKIWKDYKGT